MLPWHDKKAWAEAHGLSDFGPSLTVQSQAEEADINTIVRNFGVTGKLPQGVRLPEYGDFTGVGDFRSALEAVEAAEASFLKMPSSIREELRNDPAAFVHWVHDPANRPRLVELGLVDQPEGKLVPVGGPLGSNDSNKPGA